MISWLKAASVSATLFAVGYGFIQIVAAYPALLLLLPAAAFIFLTINLKNEVFTEKTAAKQ